MKHFVLCIIIVTTVLTVNKLHATPPTIGCDIYRGSWCIALSSTHESVSLTSPQLTGTPGLLWTTSSYGKEVMTVFESADCELSSPSGVFKATKPVLELKDGIEWTELSIEFDVEGSCNLLISLLTDTDYLTKNELVGHAAVSVFYNTVRFCLEPAKISSLTEAWSCQEQNFPIQDLGLAAW